MKKLISFIKKWCVVPFGCFLLFYPAWILGMMIAWGGNDDLGVDRLGGAGDNSGNVDNRSNHIDSYYL